MTSRKFLLNDADLAKIERAMQESELDEVRRRAKAIYLLHTGEKPDDVAEIMSVSKSTIYNWHARWRTEGIEGLEDKQKGPKKEEETQITYSKAKELLGKWVTIRKEPNVRADAVDSLEPYSIVQFVEIVPDSKNHDWEWLKLSEGHYVNYDYPPNGLRYKLLPDVPDLPIDHYVLTAYDADLNEIQRKVLIELK